MRGKATGPGSWLPTAATAARLSTPSASALTRTLGSACRLRRLDSCSSRVGRSAKESRTWSGGAGGGAVRAREVLASLDQHPGEPLALGDEHVGFDVIADHHGVSRAGAKAGQRGSEECRGGLAHHRRLGAGGLLETREERAGIELQALAGAPVQAAVHGDQPGSPLQVAEGLVERLITELRAGPADQHDVRRRWVAFLGEAQPGPR